MISVGIDVAKGKSTICVINQYGEILCSPKDYKHNIDDLNSFNQVLTKYKEEIHFVMEATGKYHLPIYHYFKEKGFFVSIINPLEMKRYRCQGIRNPKTDRIDSMIIAQYGIDYWYRTKPQNVRTEARRELRLLGRQYEQYMKVRVARCQALNSILEQTMPGIYGILDDFNKFNGKDKLSDFVFEYWHRDNIIKSSEKVFVKKYLNWLNKKGYRQNENEACKLYQIAKTSIPTLPSSSHVTKLLVQEAVNVLREINNSLYNILNQMREIAKTFPEYETVISMGAIGESLAPRLIAEIGDPRYFHNAKALIAYAGIDAPPYQSGQFVGNKRHMSKRGSSTLRKIGYEILDCVNKHQSKLQDDPICQYFLKKRAEGKAYRVAMMAAFNKFLRIYHSRVSEVLNKLENN